MNPIYTAFYTKGTLYEAEAARLRASLDALGLPHDLRAIDSRGDWCANSKYTATHICNMLAEYPNRPVVQLDADAVVWHQPLIFEKLGTEYDIAVHYRQGRELLNGTVWLAPTHAAREVAVLYQTLLANSPGCTNEQTMLAAAIEEMGERLRVYRLGPEMCFIPDIMANDLAGDEPVIGQMQASRERSGPHDDAWQRRRKWIELDGLQL